MKQEDLNVIGEYVKSHMAEWIKESNVIPFITNSDIKPDRDESLTERIVRVEEGIKHQGDLLEKMLEYMEKRFEQVDKRFEQVDKRFEQVDKRFEQVDKRFEQVDKRFEELRHDMNARFEQVDKRFSQLQWTMGIGFTIIAALMGVINFL